ncbi:MAG: pyruvate, phosphate dikinase [Bdellovibrionales bacterium]|nr:pyruvate, phosphate dikinase [Bdellovibrionales bacterium]
MMLPNKFIYFFAAEQAEGHAGMKELLGGKGANLAEMTAMGLPVPPGFTISTEMCQVFYQMGQTLPVQLKENVMLALARVEKILGKKFGDRTNPLLVSVRSGSRASMPGMMDTILNLGLNDETVVGLAEQSRNPRFAWDSYRRFMTMYSDVVMGMNSSLLEVELEDLKHRKKYHKDSELTVEDLQNLIERYKFQIHESTGQTFPRDPVEQLWGAIQAVFRSWNTPRALTYRELHGYPDSWGTAVNIQAMVFGNLGDDSATGVAFTRNPSTGEKAFFGEFLTNAQGEDVVAGIRTPLPLTRQNALKSSEKGATSGSLEEIMPEAFAQLEAIYQRLEKHYRDMQDIEFTIERGKLFMLQTRNGKRTARAAVKIACDMLDEKLITEQEALLRVSPQSLDQLLHPTLDPKDKKINLAKGLPASPGGASGQVVFSSEMAAEWAKDGKKVILVRVETSPEDIDGMIAAQGVLTTRGGMTSHAAVVARGMGKCCVAGCGEAEVDYRNNEMRANGFVVKQGDLITLDGGTGEVFLGQVNTIQPSLDGDFERVMKMADKYRKLGLRANADTPHDARVARDFGAEGIGLCRTEHMFFGPDRIDVVRKMILAQTREERVAALDQLLPMQKSDFIGIFQAMSGFPVTIRLLDPPLHEFLPHSEGETKELAQRLGWSLEQVQIKVRNLKEFNPMLGHRGCRLAITYPEIYQMQVRAIAEAVLAVKGKATVKPEIMIPIVGTEGELKRMKALVDHEIKTVQNQHSATFDYQVGTMIELPRAALIADELAQSAEFFSFGTNDLTQTTMGISRDDAGRFLGTYVSEGILEADPFTTIDQKGVGKLVEKAVELGRGIRSNIKLGICGEHGGDPESVKYFNSIGLHYVSCSPYRVPIARLAAAQAALQQRKVEH